MFDKIINFLKYNNATIIILAIVLIVGGGALAAGPENIGQKQTSIEGIDNTLLLSVDLATFNMDFKIETIEQDEKYYYVTYSYLDIVIIDNAWQYQLNQNTQKVSKRIKQDIGEYMAKFLVKHHEARIRELTEEQKLAQAQGQTTRVEVTEYSGLVGLTLDLASTVFPGYEPVVKKELPTPDNFNLPETTTNPSTTNGVDNLTQIYNDYVATHPEIFETSTSTETTETPNPTTQTEPEPTITEPETPATPETPTITEPTSVDIIELPDTTNQEATAGDGAGESTSTE
jgi:hypothetical protein